jgi:hypothetical protein
MKCSLFYLTVLLFRAFRIQQETGEVELANVTSFCESVGASISK